ncbi:MAG TPA: hypothetical protein VIZ67_07000 [Acidimicrobiales bacterium]
MLSQEGGAAIVIWRRRRDSRAQQYGWLAGGLLDEALRVFGALQAAYLEDGRLDGKLREHFRATALDLLDDVAHLAPLVVTAPTWPVWPHEPGPEAATNHRGETPALEAVQALAAYSARLASIAGVLVAREDEPATVFVGLAAAAEARIEALAS